jgi:phosphotransferase system HPr (HPr) family protein
MPEIEVRIVHPVGLHARPASLFVQTAKKFQADITVSLGGKVKNAKNMLGVLTLGASQGALIKIEAQGDDADQALAALQSLVEDNFGEAEV